MAPLSLTTKGVIGAFIGSGVIHLVRPQAFESIVPAQLPRKRELVYASGVAELVCAAGLLTPRTRRLAGLASAGLLVSVLPANAQMAWDAHRAVVRKGSTPRREAMRAGTIARLPLQIPMIRAVLRAR
ncbi:DoxX family protein [Leekyejoonella antrihumi]|uniref:DoxX family protein n=1 Tax=Leekyejoonella antrihumi TaxID=1660198 RepID=A0A563DW02_9MICO|nr:MauE/DoxX family redox-associated membrane protein [Leekyejoonella antrihumi]TWP34375.1 DoxX family protein [Leekyejoonella antrihumi]